MPPGAEVNDPDSTSIAASKVLRDAGNDGVVHVASEYKSSCVKPSKSHVWRPNVVHGGGGGFAASHASAHTQWSDAAAREVCSGTPSHVVEL